MIFCGLIQYTEYSIDIKIKKSKKMSHALNVFLYLFM